MRFAAPYLTNEYACIWFFDIAGHFYLTLYYPGIDTR